jgi:hypothetical protein
LLTRRAEKVVSVLLEATRIASGTRAVREAEQSALDNRESKTAEGVERIKQHPEVQKALPPETIAEHGFPWALIG